MATKPTIKVLEHTTYRKRKHELWDKKLLHELDTYHDEIPPVFNREGTYLVGDKCWFEVRGRAFKFEKRMFLYNLRQLFVEEVDVNVVRLLKKIDRIDSHILTFEQRKLVGDYNTYLHWRHQKRLSRRRISEMKKRIKARNP